MIVFQMVSFPFYQSPSIIGRNCNPLADNMGDVLALISVVIEWLALRALVGPLPFEETTLVQAVDEYSEEQ